MHSCILRRYLCLFTLLMAAMVAFTGCGSSSGGSSGLLALLGGGGGTDSLNAPANVTASNGSFTDKVTISWDAVTDADYYQVFRCDTEDDKYELISGNETATTYDDTDTLLPDTNYYYKVKAFNGTSESDFSDFAAGKLGLEPLDTPTNVTATDGTQTGKITVSWDAVTGATYYRVSRSTSADSGYAVISGDETLTSYEDTTATPAVNYYYKVQAFNATQSSVLSDYSLGSAGLAAPADVAASDATYKDHIAVTWSSVSGAGYYRVYRSTTSGGTYDLISGDETGASYNDDDSSLSAGTDYYYKVKAFYGTVESPLSAYDAGSKGAFVVPNPPESVSATQGTYEDKVTITWNESDGADYYNVFRADTESGSYTTQIGGDLAVLTVDDTTGTVGTHYFYKVKAHNADGWSSLSNSAEGWSQEAIIPLDAPANVSASDRTSTTAVTVTWDAVSDADYYRVYRALKSDGDYVQVGGDIGTNSYSDTDTFEDLAYYYKVKAFDAIRGESAFSAVDSGRCDLTRLEYLLRYNINWEYLNTKLTLTTGFPPSSIGTSFSYSTTGDNGGSLAVAISVKILASEVTTKFTMTNYNDLNMVLGGAEKMICDYDGTGTFTGNSSVTTSGTYTGTVVENLVVTEKIRTSGTFAVTYGGGSETINFTSTWGPGIILSAPAHVSATQGTTTGAVTISWAPVYGANKYLVYRCNTSTGTYAQIGSSVSGSPVAADGTVYTYTDSTGSTTHYFYKIKAVNDYMLNDIDGSGEPQESNENATSTFSSYAEGWGN